MSQQTIRCSFSQWFFRWIYLAVLLVVSCAVGEEIPANALFQWSGFFFHAHSHNDYKQKRPLLDAVEARISSVEADLWLENGKVLVAHDRGKWIGEFETLYLKPLDQLWKENALPVRAGEPFLLWLDLKDGSAALRERLHQLLANYDCTRSGDPGRARIEVILTGHKESKEAFMVEYASGIVTRDSNVFMESDPPNSIGWSWYALDWKKIAIWNGAGVMPAEERERIQALVAKIHAKGRKLRLWNHPATLTFWQEASSAGVDRLGTDKLPQ